MSLKKLLLPLLVVIVFSAIAASAQTKQSKTEKQVADQVETLRKAMIDADGAVLSNIIADSLSYGHSSGVIETKKELLGKLASGASDFVSIDLTEQTITISGDTALVRHTLAASTNDGGKPGTVKLKVLQVWQKLGGRWQMIARQAVKIT